MSDNIAEAIYRGRVGVDGSAGLRNPTVKIITILIPLLTVVFQHTARAFGTVRFSNGEVALIAVISYVAVNINLEAKDRSSFIYRSIKWMIFVGVLNMLTLSFFDDYRLYFSFLNPTFHLVSEILDSFIDSESLMAILLFVPMYQGIRNFSTRDALWIGRKFLWGFLWNVLFQVYMIVIVSVAIINSALPLRVSVSWVVAKDKAILLKNPYLATKSSRFARLRTLVRLFSLTLIGHNTRLATAIETMTHQRGMFQNRYQDRIGWTAAVEDWIAIFLYVLGAFAIVLQRLQIIGN
jgi:hypothetical protein